MFKRFFPLLSMLLAMFGSVSDSAAQAMLNAPGSGAPDQIVDRCLELNARSGTAPFASSGSAWKVFLDATHFQDFADAEATSLASGGTYFYKKSSPGQAILIAQGEAKVQIVLFFTGENQGTYVAVLPDQPMARQMGNFVLKPLPSVLLAAKNTAPVQPTASDRLRAEVKEKNVKDHMFSEPDFNHLFEDPYQQGTDGTSLAFAYEARQSDPDYATLAMLSSHTYRVTYANDEFRRRSWMEENLPAYAAKLNRAASPTVMALRINRPQSDYDFAAKGFRVFDDYAFVTGDQAYGVRFSNQAEATFFKIPEDAAAGIASKRRLEPGANYSYSLYFVVDGVGQPYAKFPKVVTGRVIGIVMWLGKWSFGYYNLATGEWNRSFSTESQAKAAFAALKLVPAS